MTVVVYYWYLNIRYCWPEKSINFFNCWPILNNKLHYLFDLEIPIQMVYGPFKCYVKLFVWKLDTPLLRNANDIVLCHFIKIICTDPYSPHPSLCYVTLDVPYYLYITHSDGISLITLESNHACQRCIFSLHDSFVAWSGTTFISSTLTPYCCVFCRTTTQRSLCGLFSFFQSLNLPTNGTGLKHRP